MNMILRYLQLHDLEAMVQSYLVKQLPNPPPCLSSQNPLPVLGSPYQMVTKRATSLSQLAAYGNSILIPALPGGACECYSSSTF